MVAPQMLIGPVSLRTACVMFGPPFSIPPCDPQNPGVRQISSLQFCTWVWTQAPASQPAVVHSSWSVSPHGVLSGSFG